MRNGIVSEEAREVAEGQVTEPILCNDNPSGFYSVDGGEFMKCFQAWKWLKIWVLGRLC